MNKNFLLFLLILISLGCQRWYPKSMSPVYPDSNGIPPVKWEGDGTQSIYFYNRLQYELPPTSSGVINWQGSGADTLRKIPYIYDTDGVIETDTVRKDTLPKGFTKNGYSKDFRWGRPVEPYWQVQGTFFDSYPTKRDPNAMNVGFPKYKIPDPVWVDTLEWQTAMYQKYKITKRCPVDTSRGYGFYSFVSDTTKCPGQVVSDTVIFNHRLDSCMLTALVWAGNSTGVREVHLKYIVRFNKTLHYTAFENPTRMLLYNFIPYDANTERFSRSVHVVEGDGRVIKTDYILKVLKSESLK